MSDSNQTEDQKTADPTSTEEETSVEDSKDDSKGRSAEDRIHELLSKNKQLNDRLSSLEQKVTVPPPAPAEESAETVTPEVQKAIDLLKKTGKFVDQADLKRQIQEVKDSQAVESEHQRLANLIDGSDGRPTYNRGEVEEYARKTGIWNLEAAYEQLHKTELSDWIIKKAEADRKKKPFIAKPNSTSQEREDSTITREKVSSWLNGGPEGRAQYELNRPKILELMAKGLL